MDENQNQINPEPFDSGRDALLSGSPTPPGAIDAGQSAKNGRSGWGGGFIKKIVKYIFISVFVISLITNFYLVLLLSGGMTERVYRSGDEMRVVDVVQAPGIVLSHPRKQFEGRVAPSAVGDTNYEVTLDDQRFLMVKRMEDWPTEVNVILNWSDELGQLVHVEN